jgi:hypothetical protein
VSLRARILVTVVLVATLGLLVADVATYRYLSSFLLDRVDAQLASAVDPSAHLLNEPQFGGSGSDTGGDNALFPAGTYAAVLNADGDEVLGRFFYEDVSAAKPDFPNDLPGTSAGGATQRTLTVDSADGSTDFRVLAIPLQQQGTLAIAIPLTDVAQTLSRLLVIEAIVTMSVLAALGAASWWLVRLGLRPPATSRGASRRRIRAPRSGGSASRSTRCSRGSRRRSRSDETPRSVCVVSRRTRHTSSGRRSRRCADTPSCSGAVPPTIPRRSRTRCVGSSRRASG